MSRRLQLVLSGREQFALATLARRCKRGAVARREKELLDRAILKDGIKVTDDETATDEGVAA